MGVKVKLNYKLAANGKENILLAIRAGNSADQTIRRRTIQGRSREALSGAVELWS